MKTSYSVLLVEDDHRILNGMKNALSSCVAEIHEVYISTNGNAALEILQSHSPDFIITDLCMPVMGGLEFVKRMREHGFEQPVIVLTAMEDFSSAQMLIKHRIENYILKPFSMDEIIEETSRIIGKLSKAESLHMAQVLLDNRPEIVNDAEDSSTNALVRDAKDYIKSHLAESLALQDIASVLHISKAYLCTLFKREVGTTVNDYITKQRLKEAKRLLSETDLRIGEICEKVGYQSDKYFIQVFRVNEGTTPLSFRQSLRQQINKIT